MTARTLEAHGIATVVIGSAWDILEACGTPRVVYNDLPLGNPVGKPYDRDMQRATMLQALNLLATADEPTTQQTAFSWAENEDWKRTFMRLDNKDPADLLRLGDENRRNRKENRAKGLYR